MINLSHPVDMVMWHVAKFVCANARYIHEYKFFFLLASLFRFVHSFVFHMMPSTVEPVEKMCVRMPCIHISYFTFCIFILPYVFHISS